MALTIRHGKEGSRQSKLQSLWILLLSITISLSVLVPMKVGAYVDPNHVPAIPTNFAAKSLLQGAATAGNRLVAVGARGHIIVSEDSGKTWRQVLTPASSDLVAVMFPGTKLGWAVGHGGIVLHTADSGNTWIKQLDGKQATELALRYYEAQEGEAATISLRKLKSAIEQGLTQSLLDVYFENDRTGFIVGTFNRIFRTNDGGKSWVPWMDRIDNPRESHLYSIRGSSGQIYITGERGMVWRLDFSTQRFVLQQTPYNGTLFGSVVDLPNIVVFGMRNNVLHSSDEGKTWKRAQVRTESGVMSEAGINAGTVMADGRIVLVSELGEIAISTDHGKTFDSKKIPGAMPYYGIHPISDNAVMLTGSTGVRVRQLP